MAKPTKKVQLKPGEEYIQLGKLLKYVGIIERGSDVKEFLTRNKVTVDGNPENRRGAKIRPGSKVSIPDGTSIEVCASSD